MNKLVIFICLLVVSFNASALNLPAEDLKQSKMHCEKEWTKRGVLDNGMFNFCMNREHEGFINFVSLAKKYSNEKWIQKAVDFSLQEWTKRGVTQYSMVHFELNQIVEGWEDLIYIHKQPNWNNSRYQQCANTWGIRFNMVRHCYERE